MPLYDLKCPNCGEAYKDILLKWDEPFECTGCKGQCVRLPGRMSFKVNGHNAENGYSYKPTVLDNPPR